jgi:tRNA dimethylallyltransferase
MKTTKYDIITILGGTAGGKTTLAAHTALRFNGEVISADSRQVYKGMDIGTGKDLEDFSVNGITIPYHLIDIVDAGYKYNVFEFQKDFLNVYNDLKERSKLPVLCGGTGMYIDAVLRGYKLINVPHNENKKHELEQKSDHELIEIVSRTKDLHNTSDTSTRKRLVRAAEIALYYEQSGEFDFDFPKIISLNIHVVYDRDTRRKRISERLACRLKNGMIHEVKQLIDRGLDIDTLKYYGLEYKFITEYLLHEISYDDMYDKLEIAIHQFSKRQMTWFRKMEKVGHVLHNIDGNLPIENKLEIISGLLYK